MAILRKNGFDDKGNIEPWIKGDLDELDEAIKAEEEASQKMLEIQDKLEQLGPE